MSFLHHPDDIEAPNMNIWNNAAFDNEDSYGSATIKSLISDCSKENLCPLLCKTPASVKYPVPVKPLNPNGVIGNSQRKSLKTPATKNFGTKEKEEEEVISKERNIDLEIEETEKEMSLLSMRLKSLQIEKAKAEQNARTIKLNKPKISRRQSCFLKLQDVEEDMVMKGRGKTKSMSLSPKSRRTLLKVQPATVAVSKRVGKKGGVIEFIQPKKLFKDVEKSVSASAKKPLRSGRIVASRYNQPNESSVVAMESRKRSLPGTCKDDGGRGDKRRASSGLSRSKGVERKVKKRWEIPTEIVVYQQEVEEKYESSITNVSDVLLPKIRTIHRTTHTPRDSGPAKRVAELLNSRRNIFASEEMEASICQELNFNEDDDEE